MLILFATTAINIFCTDSPIQKRFGCHNFSSVEKIANMNSNNTELKRNLKQCMQDTGTYNKKNLDIAQKFQNKFESTEKISLLHQFYKNLLAGCFGFSYASLAASGTLFINSNDNKSREKYIYTTIASIFSVNFFSKITNKHINYMRSRKEKNKLLIAMNIKKFADTLQQKK